HDALPILLNTLDDTSHAGRNRHILLLVQAKIFSLNFINNRSKYIWEALRKILQIVFRKGDQEAGTAQGFQQFKALMHWRDNQQLGFSRRATQLVVCGRLYSLDRSLQLETECNKRLVEPGGADHPRFILVGLPDGSIIFVAQHRNFSMTEIGVQLQAGMEEITDF